MKPTKIFGAACAAFSIMCLPAQAQQKSIQVEGRVCDSLSHNPQAYATLRLLKDDGKGTPLKATVTDAEGYFKLAAPEPGQYMIEVVMLGMETLQRPLDLTKARTSVTLDTLYVKELSGDLGTATVTAQKPLVRAEIDKLTYSMADDPEAQTSSLLDMLRKVPMVTVDGEDNIKVNGSSGFKVYVNGKPNQMLSSNPSLIFKTYPASVVKKIEVITNPGAKYDAEGVAGVLNIVTESETSTKGYSLTPNIQYRNRGVAGNVFGMVQFGKFTLSGFYGVGQNKQYDSQQDVRREVFDDPVNHIYTQHGEVDPKGTYQYGNFEASYEFSSKDLLSVSGNIDLWHGKSYTDNEVRMTDAADNLTYGYKNGQHYKQNMPDYGASVDYQHTFKEDQHLTFSYRYSLAHYRYDTEVLYYDRVNVPESLDLLDLSTREDDKSAEHTAQIDFTTPLGKRHTLSAGLKYIYRINRSNDVELSRSPESDEPFITDEERSIRYRHRGDIGAAYAEYVWKNDKWSIQAGSRYEYYHVKVSYPDGKQENFSSDFSDWVPSLSTGFNITPTQMLRAGYNLRISRPDITYLSPYVEHSSSEDIRYGNPDLGSSKAHNLSLAYNSFNTKLSINTSLTYSFSNNGLSDYSFMEGNVMHTTYDNIQHSKVVSLSGYLQWTITDKTSINANFTGSYSDYRAKRTGQHNSGFAFNGFGGFRQTLPWKLKFGLWFGGGTKDVNLQGSGSSYHFYSLSFSRSFLKEDRLTVSLEGSNFISPHRRFKSTSETSQFHYTSCYRTNTLNFGIAIRYRLGSLETYVKKANRSIENDDQTQRSSGQGGGQGQGGGE